MDKSLFHFKYPDSDEFATAIRRGTWFPINAKLCPVCHTTSQRRINPLIIEWEPGSDRIGDFTWPALDTELVITQKVKECFQIQFSELEFSPIEFWQDHRVSSPKKTTKRTKPRIWLPYDGTKLWAITPMKWCSLNRKKSNVRVKMVCPSCKKTLFDVPPLSNNSLVLDTSTWNGESIFHITEYSGTVFCTSIAKKYIEEQGFTNVKFVLCGEIS